MISHHAVTRVEHRLVSKGYCSIAIRKIGCFLLLYLRIMSQMSETKYPERSQSVVWDDEFEQFLVSVGLTLQFRRGPEGEVFGNWIIQYGNNDLDVLMVSDRGDQCISIADKKTLRSHGPFP